VARAKGNGNGRLHESIATLNQAMADFLGRCAETDARIAKVEAEIVETNRINSERFARIEAILREHSQILRALPDAVRDKIGFKGACVLTG
jgi:hypothetical protein